MKLFIVQWSLNAKKTLFKNCFSNSVDFKDISIPYPQMDIHTFAQ